MQIVRELLSSISLANIVDILIMAGLVYFVMAWFKGTRAFQILTTLVGVALFYFAAARAGLVLTSLLFQYLWAAIIVVLAIVFQPEIREMLDRASSIRFLRGGRATGSQTDLVEQTVKAVSQLASMRIGALIVFERLDRLDNAILKGKQLDAVVSTEALVMVFQKTSPLHDGAVLVTGDRIKEACCILPVSTTQNLDLSYGTRHRAAVGLTERSDALCVVVSEERGEVSLVEAKEITNYRKKSDFRQALQRGLEFGKTTADGSKIPFLEFLASNWRLKVLSVAAAVALWFLFVGPQRAELGVTVPIQYTNLPTDMEITGKWLEKIDVRVRGSQTGLANLKPDSLRAMVDLNKVVPGLNSFRITTRNLVVPPGISVVEIRSPDLHLTVDEASVRKMAVVPHLVGALPDKTKVTVTPSEVQVRAIQVDLKRVTSITTEPVNVADLAVKGKLVIPLLVRPEGLKIDSVDPGQVIVALEAEKT